MRFASLIAAACVSAAPLAAAAQTDIRVDPFTAVELRGGGTITIRQGPVQKVTLVRGNPRVAEFRVRQREGGGVLVVSPCRDFCFGPHRLDVEIQTPSLNGAAIKGGGEIVAHGAFPAQGMVSASIHGGGDIDLRTVPAQAASASIFGGGKIFVAARDSLDAKIFGGGAIHYAGHPSVNSSIHGGGSVEKMN